MELRSVGERQIVVGGRVPSVVPMGDGLRDLTMGTEISGTDKTDNIS